MSSWRDFWVNLKLETVKRCEGNKYYEEILLGMADIVGLKQKVYFREQVLLVEKQIQELESKMQVSIKLGEYPNPMELVELDELRGVLKTYKELSEGLK